MLGLCSASQFPFLRMQIPELVKGGVARSEAGTRREKREEAPGFLKEK